ncbi:hypothetical protein ACTWP5_01330 [Streptomyces sp. 4N509B]|uniref:hypothetical protein n=1 Tax=Streptomyces sp. 4N509B TaxID=3457413 RepID=UPI003FD1227A
MPEWSFTLVLNRNMTIEQADRIDTADEPLFADGSVSYTLGGRGPSTLQCDVEAPSLLEAVARVAVAIRRVPGLRAVAAEHDDLVTLGEAAQRLRGIRTRQSLVQLSKGQRGPGGFPAPEGDTTGTAFYSWAKIADFLRGLGDDVPETDRDIALADRVLRTSYELDVAQVPQSLRRDFGLCAA